MRVSFLTDLDVRKLDGDRWELREPFVVEIDGKPLTVPKGFSNDMASVPRLPLAYLLAGNTAHRSGVVHDYLYATKAPRDYADEVFSAAMKTEGVPGWRRALMYAAVRAFGGAYYEKREPHTSAPETPA